MTADRAFDLAALAGNDGFRHYAFISYPNTDEMRRFASKFRDGLEGLLRLHLPSLHGNGDYVFCDQSGIPPGVLWEKSLSQSLCHSLTLIALCVPMYAHPEHSWCGREWRGMWELGEARLPEGITSIFPVRLGDGLHPVINQIQQFWAPRKALRWVPRCKEFDNGLDLALQHIHRVLESRVGAAADCAGFQIPDVSAFAKGEAPTLPNRTPINE